MSRRHTAILTLFLALVLSVQASSSQASSSERNHGVPTAELRYRLVKLFRTLPDGQREDLLAVSLNDKGEVLATGSLRDASNDPFPGSSPRPRVFIWRAGRVVTELISPDAASPNTGLRDVEALRINNRSEVVGSLVLYDPGYTARRAFRWRHGTFTFLEPLPGPPYIWSFAWSINDWGEVVGFTVDNDFNVYSTPFRWFRGHSSRVPVDPALSAGTRDINNLGQVIGYAYPGPYDPYEGPYGGYLADRKGNVHFLETLPGSERMNPIAINDRGQVIGTASNRSMLWEDGTALDLGTLPGASGVNASAINIFSTIVGVVSYPSGDTTAMIWRDGEMRDLNELIAGDDPVGSSVHLVTAGDINNLGWITAVGQDANDPHEGQLHGYLLIPVWKHRH